MSEPHPHPPAETQSAAPENEGAKIMALRKRFLKCLMFGLLAVYGPGIVHEMKKGAGETVTETRQAVDDAIVKKRVPFEISEDAAKKNDAIKDGLLRIPGAKYYPNIHNVLAPIRQNQLTENDTAVYLCLEDKNWGKNKENCGVMLEKFAEVLVCTASCTKERYGLVPVLNSCGRFNFAQAAIRKRFESGDLGAGAAAAHSNHEFFGACDIDSTDASGKKPVGLRADATIVLYSDKDATKEMKRDFDLKATGTWDYMMECAQECGEKFGMPDMSVGYDNGLIKTPDPVHMANRATGKKVSRNDAAYTAYKDARRAQRGHSVLDQINAWGARGIGDMISKTVKNAEKIGKDAYNGAVKYGKKASRSVGKTISKLLK